MKTVAAVIAAALVLGTVSSALAAPPPPPADQDMGRAVQELLRVHRDDIAGCVGNGTLTGEALLDLHAGESGSVALVRVLRSDDKVQATARCVAGRAKDWSVALLGLDAGDQIVVPLVFRPEARPTVRVVEVVKQLDVPAGLHAIATLGGTAQLEWNSPITGKGRFELNGGNAAVLAVAVTISKAHGKLLIIEFPSAADALFKGVAVIGWSSNPVYTLPGDRGSVQLGTDGLVSVPFAFDRLTVKGDVQLQRHQHDDATEIVVPLEGRGISTVAGVATPIVVGAPIEIAPSVPHGLTTQSETTVLQFYYPRGPEQRFKPVTKP